MTVTTLIWIVFIVLALQPLLQQRLLKLRRLNLINELQKSRGSRVIVLIHRQEQVALLGVPLYRYIDVDDSEQILRVIRQTPADVPIDLILHTPGGLVLAAEQIALALTKHPAPVTVLVPHYAMSGGTLIALAADEILMDDFAVLGPVDPQLGQYPAVSILKAAEAKEAGDLDDETLIMADIAAKAVRQVRDLVETILIERDRYGALAAETDQETEPQTDNAEAATPAARRVAASRYELIDAVTSGRWTHDYPITADHARELGLPVRTELPRQVFELMALYPQPTRGRPTVEYIPLPSPPRSRGKETRS